MTPTLDQTQLKELFHYDPETGMFTWLKTGTVAGWVDVQGYPIIQVQCRNYRAGRLAYLYMTGEWPDEIDHINGRPEDSRWLNLRSTDRLNNMRNVRLRDTNISGCHGVTWDKTNHKWKVRINRGPGDVIWLGRHVSKQKAIAIRKAAEAVYGYHPNHGRGL